MPAGPRREVEQRTTTTPSTRVAHVHCVRSGPGRRSGIRSYRSSSSGPETPMPSWIASPMTACSASRPFWFVVSPGNNQSVTSAPDGASPAKATLGGRRLDGLLGHIAPEVVEPVELARLRREDVQDDVEVVGDDPRRLALPRHRAGQKALVLLQARMDLVPDALRLARVVPRAHDEIVGVGAHRLHVEDDDVP